MKRLLPALLIIMLFCSHDMFLKLEGFFLQPQAQAEVQLFNGTFEKSENVIDRDRMIDMSLVGNGQRIAVDSAQWFEKDSTTFLRFTTGDAGTWVAGVSTKPRLIELAAPDFNGYLEHDGIIDMLEQRKNNNTLDQDAIERYSKHVKTLFQVGDQLSDDWKTVLGYPIEFVPQGNPYDLHPGHSLKVTLLLEGQPLADQLVYVGHQPTHGHTHNGQHTHDDGTTHSHNENTDHGHSHEGVRQLRTDDNGQVELDIDAGGVWYLRTIHLVTVEEAGLTHESNWATLTFAVGEGHAHEHDTETHHHHEEGLASYWYWIGSVMLIILFFVGFNRKKK
ncbi:DUF4198 domain-containing protein [Flagellimonas sp. DF-77]|uniref:DUF4198 domain-containing protein n=1 Tax=Flagellimonas algarum TaxID=3230298 RepID=UPI003397846E